MKQSKVKWRLEQSADKTLLYIYDDVTEYGEFNWNTWEYEESDTSAKYFKDQLNSIADGSEIELHINSNGGSVKEGTAIYNLLKQKQGHKVGVVDGVAHSIAFLILQACDVRRMGLGTSALVHNMWMGCYGNALQLRKYADDLDVLSETNRKVFLERSTISEQELKDIMDAETYLTPEKALAYGLIDEVTGQKVEANENQLNQMMEQMKQMRQQLNNQQSFREQLQQMSKTAPEQKKEPKNMIFETFKNFGGK